MGSEYSIGAVQDGAARIVEVGPEISVAKRVCRETGAVRCVLPDPALAPAQSHPLLVVSLDQGSVGAAGIVFAQEWDLWFLRIGISFTG